MIVNVVNIRRNVAERWLQRWKVQRWLRKYVLKIFPLENKLERIFQFGGLDKPFPIKATIDGFENLSSPSIDDSLESRYVGCQNLYSFIHNTCYNYYFYFDVTSIYLVQVLVLLMGMMLDLDCTGSLSQTILSPCRTLLV